MALWHDRRGRFSPLRAATLVVLVAPLLAVQVRLTCRFSALAARAAGAAGTVVVAEVVPGPLLELDPPPQLKVSPDNSKTAKTRAFLGLILKRMAPAKS